MTVALLAAMTSFGAVAGDGIEATSGNLGEELKIAYELCKNDRFAGRCVEAYQLKRYPKVRRNGNRLMIGLADGQHVVLTDNVADSGDSVAYSFYGAFLGNFLVLVHLYEGSEYLAIHGRSGKKYFVHGWPVVSPDQRRFVTTSLDITSGYNANAVQVWRVDPDQLVLEWSLEPGANWGPSDAWWLGNDVVQFMRNEHEEVNGEVRDINRYVQHPLTLKRAGQSWKLTDHRQ